MANNNALPTGSLLSSDTCTYRIVSTLGSGGFGITYLVEAQMVQDGRVHSFYYAMKEHFMSSCCERTASTDEMTYSRPVATMVENSLKDFIAEAKRLQVVGARHNNIVKVKEIFQQNNTAYYVMEYLQGDSLRKYVESKGKLSEEETLRLMEPIIDAIGYLHANKMTHLDIKPDNIMLTPAPDGSQRPVLIDFGLSKHYDESNRPTSTINTQGCSDGYAPMEQYGGISTFSPTADIYALGATMAYCLTGKAPTKSTDIDISEVNAFASNYGSLGVVISKMMQPGKTARPQSIREVYDLLNTPTISSATPPPIPTLTVPPTPPIPTIDALNIPSSPTSKDKSKSNRWLIIAGCIAGALALGAGGYALFHGDTKHSYDRYNSAGISEYYETDSEPAAEDEAPYTITGYDAPVRVALEWSEYEDLDLYVVQPDGETVYWLNTDFDGFFSGDSTANSSIRAEAIGFNSPQRGHYDVFACAMAGLSDKTEAYVDIINGNSRYCNKVVLKSKGENVYYKVAEFDYYGDSPSEDASTAEIETDTIVPDEASTTVSLPDDGIPVTYADNDSETFGTVVSNYATGNVSTAYDASAVRRVNNTTGTTSLRVSLLWDSSNDLDLIVNQQDGTYLWYSNQTDSNHGATFGGDHSGGSGSYEYAKWTSPGSGAYDIFVRVRGTVPETGIIVRMVVSENNRNKCYATRIIKNSSDYKDVRLCRYYYDGSSSSNSSDSTSSDSSGSTSSGIATTYGTSSYQSYNSGDMVSNYITANTTVGYDATAISRAARVGSSGDCKVTLLWNFDTDCDLIVNTCNGKDVCYSDKTESYTGARHSGDVTSGGTGEAVTFSSPKAGVYDFFVRIRGSVNHGLVQLVVTEDGSSTVYSTYTPKAAAHRTF